MHRHMRTHGLDATAAAAVGASLADVTRSALPNGSIGGSKRGPGRKSSSSKGSNVTSKVTVHHNASDDEDLPGDASVDTGNHGARLTGHTLNRHHLQQQSNSNNNHRNNHIPSSVHPPSLSLRSHNELTDGEVTAVDLLAKLKEYIVHSGANNTTTTTTTTSNNNISNSNNSHHHHHNSSNTAFVRNAPPAFPTSVTPPGMFL